jgi:hypothetical protein
VSVRLSFQLPGRWLFGKQNRAALRVSKRRVRPESDPKALITQFYRMPTTVANDLETTLPRLIQTDTWKSQNPNAKGTIQKIQSWSETTGLQSKTGIEGQPTPYSVLVIYQTREIHDQLPELLRRIQHGDGMRGGIGGILPTMRLQVSIIGLKATATASKNDFTLSVLTGRQAILQRWFQSRCQRCSQQQLARPRLLHYRSLQFVHVGWQDKLH